MNDQISITPDLSKLRTSRDIDAELSRVRDSIALLTRYESFLKSARSFFDDGLSGSSHSSSPPNNDVAKISPTQSFRSAVFDALKNAHGEPISIKEIWQTLRLVGIASSHERPVQQVSATLANLKSRGEHVENIGNGVWRYTGTTK